MFSNYEQSDRRKINLCLVVFCSARLGSARWLCRRLLGEEVEGVSDAGFLWWNDEASEDTQGAEKQMKMSHTAVRTGCISGGIRLQNCRPPETNALFAQVRRMDHLFLEDHEL